MLSSDTNYIVSGLERSGTSLMMQILYQGGLPVASDNSRPPNEHNPYGYFELAGGKIINRLMHGTFDVESYRGKIIKVTAYGLKLLPYGKYKIIYMMRNIEEVLTSMEKMGAHIDREKDRKLFSKLNGFSFKLMEHRPDMEYVTINYANIIADPKTQIESISHFLGVPFDFDAAIKAVDSTLYRNRADNNVSNQPEGAHVMINRKARHIHWTQGLVTRSERECLKRHRGFTLWFTGLSASGKSTLAVATERALYDAGSHIYILDGDNIRHGLNKNLGFSPEDRTENIRRIGEVAKLFRDSGIINLVAFISPYRSDRNAARELSNGNGTFIEVFVDCPIEVCEQRDPRGMYKKARDGIVKEFTGVSAPYEPPENPEIHLRTDQSSAKECVKVIMDYLAEYGLITASPYGQLVTQPRQGSEMPTWRTEAAIIPERWE